MHVLDRGLIADVCTHLISLSHGQLKSSTESSRSQLRCELLRWESPRPRPRPHRRAAQGSESPRILCGARYLSSHTCNSNAQPTELVPLIRGGASFRKGDACCTSHLSGWLNSRPSTPPRPKNLALVKAVTGVERPLRHSLRLLPRASLDVPVWILWDDLDEINALHSLHVPI